MPSVREPSSPALTRGKLGTLASSVARRILWLAMLLLLAASPGSVAAASNDSVRTGTTDVSSDPARNQPGTNQPATAGSSMQPQSGQPQPGAPSGINGPEDAPRWPHARLKLADPPSGFNTYDVGWIRFAYPPSERQRVEPLIHSADEVRAEIRERLGSPVLSQLRVYVARTTGELAALAPEGITVPKLAVGMAFSDLDLVLLSLNPRYPNDHHDVVEIFKHELAHVALHESVQDAAIPHWFDEGFAVHASGESPLFRLRELSTATLSDKLIPLDQLALGFPSDPVRIQLAYAQSADIVRFLLRQQERSRFAGLLERTRSGQDFNRALEDAYNTTSRDLELEWHKDVAKRYTFWPVLLSGGLVWVGAFLLFVWGWHRRKTRDRATLARWAREEARAEALHEAQQPTPVRVHVVLARPQPRAEQAPSLPEVEVPKVQHEGQWHTLH